MSNQGPVMLDLRGNIMGPDRETLLARHERYGAALASLSGSDSVSLNVVVPRVFRNSPDLGWVAPHVFLSAGFPQLDPRFYASPNFGGLRHGKPSVWVASDPFKTGPLQYFAARRTSSRFQVQVHGDFGRIDRDGAFSLSAAKVAVANRVFRGADSVRAVSRVQSDSLIQRFSIDPHKLFVSHVPLDSVFYNTPLVQVKDPPSVLFVGRLHPERGLAKWAETARVIARGEPSTRFRIIGAGSSETEFRRMLAGIAHVSWHGRSSAHEVAQVMTNSHVLLSTPPLESYGRSLVEALCLGMQVVATDTTGARRIEELQGVHIAFRPKELADLVVAALQTTTPVHAVENFRAMQSTRDERSIQDLARSWL